MPAPGLHPRLVEVVQEVGGLGRSRGGFTSKIHLSSDGHCRPLSLIVMPGQRADCTRFELVLE